ncbi:MAG: hypothetical protein R2725_13725 [Solirubrobacterales bacterium]
MRAHQIAIATCSQHPRLIADDLALVASLREFGIDSEPVVWNADEEVEWAELDGCLLRSVWDYHLRRADFLAWTEAVAATVPLWNPPATLRWNTTKGYLRELAAAGVPTIPTAWLGRGEAVRLDRLLAERGWREAVLKPSVDLGAERLVRVRRGEGQALLDSLLAEHDVLAQPFMASVERHGEVSLVFFDGELSHTVRKLPRHGDFRVQSTWGGTAAAVAPTAAQRQVADRALGEIAEELLYARVDLIEGAGGEPLLTELELVEPNLYLSTDRSAANRLAAAISRRLRG